MYITHSYLVFVAISQKDIGVVIIFVFLYKIYLTMLSTFIESMSIRRDKFKVRKNSKDDCKL